MMGPGYNSRVEKNENHPGGLLVEGVAHGFDGEETAMKTRFALMSLLVVLVLAVAGCTSSDEPPIGVPDSQEPPAGLRLAPGLYELEDGTAQAVGTLEWRDLEGGFWAVTGGTEAEGNVGETVAVIANGSEFTDELEPLAGKQVIVVGKTLDGASIRMAGPEIEMESVEEISDTPGAAE